PGAARAPRPLLPAMLSIPAPHINSLRVRGRHPGRRDPAHPHKGLWARWAEAVARHPVIAMVAALAILIPLAVPLLSLNLGQKDVAALSTSTTERRAYDLISQNFGPGVNGPLLVAVSLGSPAQAPASSSSSSSSGSSSSQGSDPRASDPRLQTLEKDVSATQGVAAVTPLQIDKVVLTAYLIAIPTRGPAEQATADLVSTLRSSVIPAAGKGTN